MCHGFASGVKRRCEALYQQEQEYKGNRRSFVAVLLRMTALLRLAKFVCPATQNEIVPRQG